MLGSLSYTRQQLRSLIEETTDHFNRTQRLPNFAYTSKAFLELEQLTLFARNWIFAGRASQLQNVGDVLPVEVAGQDVLLVRQGTGKVAAFFNVCPHRGAKLAETPRCKARFLSCRYHGWSFALDGTPRMRPHFHGGDKHEDNPAAKGLRGLTEIRTHQWLDFIFVNLDGQAEPFGDWMRPILNALAPYDFSKLTYVRTIEYDLESNWKLALENFWDTYHIPTCHPAVERQMKMADRTNAVTEGKIIFGGYQYPVDDADGKVGRASPIPGHDGDRDYMRSRSWFICCCPSNMIQVWEDAFIMVEMRPVAPDRTHEKFHFYMHEDAATQDEHACGRDQVIGFMDGFQLEDMDIVRWMQQGRSSVAYDGGELSDYWDPQVITFGRMVTDGIQETRS